MTKPKELLNELQSTVHRQLLKKMGFKKSGRTFNRISNDGLIEVINFQSGRYEFGQEIPGLRENLYGSFTINIGICIPENFKHTFDKEKKFYHEYDCDLRARIGSLMGNGEDIWWELKPHYLEDQSKRIIQLVNDKALGFFEKLNSREKIYKNWEDTAQLFNLSISAKLTIATIKLLNNDKSGEKLFKEYYNNVALDQHKEWLQKEAIRLKVKL